MKNVIRMSALVAGIIVSQLCMAQAPAGAPAGTTGLCNDGTYYQGATKKGACRGHKGVKDWYGATSSTPAKPPAAAAAPTSTAAPAPAAAPAGATGLCNDGSYYTGESKKGACRGHKGVKEWFGATSATPAKTSVSTPAPTPAAAAPAPAAPAPASTKPTSSATTPAPSGGSGKVWLNSATNVYHCEGSRYYGKTKAGTYMSEADAKAKGARPDHGKPCQ